MPRKLTALPGSKVKSGDSLEVLAPQNPPYQMRLLVQLFGRRFQRALDPYDLTPLHWGVLCCLWQHDGLATQFIAGRLEQLGGTVTVGLDSMHKRGLVRRKPDPLDRRISRVWLTAKGAGLQLKVVPAVESLVEEMFSCLSRKERRTLDKLIMRLREHVEQLP